MCLVSHTSLLKLYKERRTNWRYNGHSAVYYKGLATKSFDELLKDWPWIFIIKIIFKMMAVLICIFKYLIPFHNSFLFGFWVIPMVLKVYSWFLGGSMSTLGSTWGTICSIREWSRVNHERTKFPNYSKYILNYCHLKSGNGEHF